MYSKVNTKDANKIFNATTIKDPIKRRMALKKLEDQGYGVYRLCKDLIKRKAL